MCYKALLNTEDIHLKTGPFLLGHAVAKTSMVEKAYLLPVKAFYRNEDYSERFGYHTYAKMW
jgi:hypothetical protein